MAYATLGPITFERVFSPDSMRFTEAEQYAVIPLAGGKPTLQHIGSELVALTYTIRMHRSFCNPDEQLSLLQSARAGAEILPLVTGDGVRMGKYVITSVGTTFTQMDHKGALVEVMCDVSLLEFYDPNQLATEEATAQSNAFANDSRKVVPVQPLAATPLPAQVVSQKARSSYSHTVAATENAKKATTGVDVLSKLKRAEQQVEDARTDVQQVIDRLQADAALAAKAPQMLAAAQDAAAYIPEVLEAILSGDAQGAFAKTDALGLRLQDMIRKGINIETGLLTRRP